MNFNRRTFIKTSGGAALASILPLDSIASLLQSQQSTTGKPVVCILSEPNFPLGEITHPDQTSLATILKDFEIRFLKVQELNDQLHSDSIDVFLNPYGSHFPKESWGAIIKYLKGGGNWINLGGVPFSIPVVRDGTGWSDEIPQTAYHKKISITQSFPVETKGLKQENIMKLDYDAQNVFELYFRLTETKDFPNEDGPAGARDAYVKPLSYCLSIDGKRFAAPLVEINQMQGEYAGGRWILANYTGSISAETIRTLVERVLFGAVELTARTSFASYFEGETPSFTIQFRHPKGNVEKLLSQECELELINDKKKTISHLKLSLKGEGTVATAYQTLKKDSLIPGLYTVKTTQNIQLPDSPFSEKLTYVAGFWVYDKKLMESGKPFTVNETFLLKDNQPYPVTGTTYMGSDVHRKFLFEPNPALWDNDFAEMKGAGINMVRTGIWTAWKNYMLDVGTPSEATLRAVDAFILTARKYDIPVIFTFFAFLPEMWGGINPYLDPRSVNAQKEFITAFTQRYKGVNDILWDLINEPSFCNPQQLWNCRPNYDKYEVEAWAEWLKKRYPAGSDEQRISKLQELYRTTADDALALPALEEFDDANIFNDSQPVKIIDYRLFAQDMFVLWIQEMSKAIRSNGNPAQIITVGQDEGGTFERPSPQFFAGAVDFTCIHNWWNNDDLLWDGIVTKAPGKPNLSEETGVMFYEKMDGSAWRTEQEAANLLERKLAMSFCSGGAGFIEWIWTTNPYMKSDNEAAIGIHRVDGTVKPELEPLERYAKFIAANKYLMIGKTEEEVVMVIPHSQMFSTRNFATEATQKCVRTMAYHCGIPVQAFSEYRLDELKSSPKLIIVPSPRTLNENAWSALMKFAAQGTTVLITGTFDADDHWMTVDRSKKIGFPATVHPIAEEEFLNIDGKEFQLSYRGEKIQRIEKAVLEQSDRKVVLSQQEKGWVIWSPLPVELSEGFEPTVALYRFALAKAGIQRLFAVEKEDSSVLIMPTIFSEAVLYSLISESDQDTDVLLKPLSTGNQIHVHVPAQRTELIFVHRKDGTLISQLNQD